jgi:hypothetical protein
VSAPAVPDVAGYWYDELAVTQPGDEARGWPLLLLVGAMGVAFGESHDLARDPEQLLDPDRIPAEHLDWLAQFAGVGTPDGTPEANTRAAINSPPAFQRGTVEAIREAARAGEGPGSALTGNQSVNLLEREGGSKKVLVITYESETPDEDATRRRIE